MNTVRSVVMNILFVIFMFFLLMFLAAIIGAMSGKGPAEIPDEAVLDVAPFGMLVEEFSGEPLDRAFEEAIGDGVPQVRLRDLVDAINYATDDNRIKLMRLDLDGLGGGGPAMYDDLAAAVRNFRAAGKPVIAVAEGFDQMAYRVAAEANEIHLNPMGIVFISGYGAYRNYYRDLLDRFDVDWNVFHAGEYKSYGEPFTRNSMSKEAKEANLAFLEDLWGNYTTSVEQARNLDAGAIMAYIDALAGNNNGDFAALAVQHGLVDGLRYPDEMNARIAELLELEGGHDAELPQADFLAYVNSQRQQHLFADASMPKIAVIIAEGAIVDGDQPSGVISPGRIGEQIENVRLDDDVKAVVLRVNSGGGSAFASELIQRELTLLQAEGKPLVVSMGTVAASGGYWISMTADQIFAQATTITGSIGVVAMVPTVERTLNRYGVHTDGVGTSPLAGALRLDRSLSDAVKRTLQSSVDHLYRQFISAVADNRELDVEFVDKVARGRVWSGQDALEHGLVDTIGGLDAAVESAASMAALDKYALQYVEPELSFMDQFLINLFNSHLPTIQRSNLLESSLRKLPLLNDVAQGMYLLDNFNDPRGLYSRCFCEIR